MINNRKTKTQLIAELEQLHCENTRLKGEVDRYNSFISELTHDLRSPTTSAKGLAMRLFRAYENPNSQEAQIASMILKVLEMIKELAEAARVFSASKASPLVLKRFNVRKIFDYLQTLLFPVLEARGIELKLPKKYLKIYADEVQIKRAFQNILTNAIDHGEEAELTEITVEMIEETENITFSFYNNGGKISREDCERIFESFVRIKNSGKGTGLGLAIVMETAKKHGGTAWAEPAGKRGVKFFFRIPKTTKISPKSC